MSIVETECTLSMPGNQVYVGKSLVVGRPVCEDLNRVVGLAVAVDGNLVATNTGFAECLDAFRREQGGIARYAS